MRIRAIAKRILLQMRGDKRTVGLILMAPILMLTLIFFILNSDGEMVVIGVINAPQSYVESLYDNNVGTVYISEGDARQALIDQEITAAVTIKNGKATYLIDGSNPTRANIALKALQQASTAGHIAERPDLRAETEYIYGSADLDLFDNYGSGLIGFVVFFFVFLIAGINFLTERKSGTLEKMLSTPVKRREIIFGYICGFGIVTVLQTVVVVSYLIYVLKIIMIGSFWTVLLITLLTSMCALTLGMLLSSLAQNEFQFVQFIPVVIIPQLFFSGIFQLSSGWNIVGYFLPLKYAADALSRVMMRGEGPIGWVTFDLAVLLAFTAGFVLMNVRVLKKYREL